MKICALARYVQASCLFSDVFTNVHVLLYLLNDAYFTDQYAPILRRRNVFKINVYHRIVSKNVKKSCSSVELIKEKFLRWFAFQRFKCISLP